MVHINRKVGRSVFAVLLAFLPVFFVYPASASEMTLEQAQAALVEARQELEAASQSKQVADANVASASDWVNVTLASKSATAVTVSGTSSSITQNVVLNGTFDDASAWSNIQMYQPSYFNNSSIPLVINSQLVGSYTAGVFVLQTGNFAAPTRTVSFAVDVWNNNNQRNDAAYDYYRIEFRTYDAAGNRLNYYNLQYSGAFHDWITRGATYSLPTDAVRWDIGFRFADGGYWNGNYGPIIDNVRLVAEMVTSTPDTVTYDEQASQTHSNAVISYSEAVALQVLASNRLQAAIAEVERLEALVVSLTPATPSWWQVEWWENSPVTISIMNDGYVFSSIQAWYGDPQQTCGYDVTPSLSPLIIGYSSASFVVSNDLFGDPCPGIVKVLRFAASISQVVSESPTISESVTVSPATESQDISESATVSESVPVVTPTPEPTVTPQPEPTPVQTQEPSQPAITPTPEPAPEPTSTPSPEPTPETSPQPEPLPSPTPTPQPETEPSPQPSPTPSPSEPVVEPKPTPTPSPSPKPTVVPVQPSTPVEKPIIPTPTPEPTPSVTPTPSVPEPSEKPDEEVVINKETVIENISSINPDNLSPAQAEQLVAIANEIFASAEPGSEEYEAALDALLVVAQADDIIVNEELASTPVIGAAVVAVADALNALGNAGADMSPQVREQSEKVVIAAVIVGQVAMTATAAATSAAAAAARRP